MSPFLLRGLFESPNPRNCTASSLIQISNLANYPKRARSQTSASLKLAPEVAAHTLGRMIEVIGLSKSYGDFLAVQNLSFAVRAGEVLGLVGPNGAGKTTTLRCLTGIIPPTRGQMRIAGIDLATDPLAGKRQLAFFPDEPRLFENLSVWQHLVFTARLYQLKNYEPTARELLQQLEMTGKEKLMPGELSRGMKQKLALACGLLHQPRAIFFDEPLTGLDPAGIRAMKATMLRLAREGAAIILSSHLLSLLEEVCSHVLILKNGEKVVDGTLAHIRELYSNGGETTLEDVFFRATEDAPPPLPPEVPSPVEPPSLSAPSAEVGTASSTSTEQEKPTEDHADVKPPAP